MARIVTSPFSRALVIESPHMSLDDHLRGVGIEPTRLDSVTSFDVLIDAINATGSEVLFKRSRVPVTREVLAACPGLYAVQLCCIGDDSVDKDACVEAGVLVFNDPVSNARSVVELAVGHIISLSRRLYATNAASHSHIWDKTNRERYEILGKSIGIVGLGNIGRQVARACEALGMKVRFYDSRPVAQEVGQEMGWIPDEDLGSLFRNSDVVSVHTSAKDAWGTDNEGLLDPYLSLLGAERPPENPRIFLNLARANVHSPASLLAAVGEGQVTRAAIDVYPDEPAPGSASWVNPYAEESRVVCTPHIGAATQEAQPRIARRVAATIGNFSRFGKLRDCVFSPRAKMEVPDAKAGNAVLGVVHSTERGTKKAVDDAIYAAGASNLGSVHRDFPNGIAYDLAVIDRPLEGAQLEAIAAHAMNLAGDPNAIRVVRQLVVSETW